MANKSDGKPPNLQLHEHLVAQTLRMNPGLAGGQVPSEFIRNQTSKLGDLAKQVAKEKGPDRTAEVRRLSAHLLGERRKQQQAVADIDRRRKQLDKEAADARKEAVGQIVSYLARNVHSVEDLQAVLEDSRIYLQELATSGKDITEMVASRRRNLSGA